MYLYTYLYNMYVLICKTTLAHQFTLQQGRAQQINDKDAHFKSESCSYIIE